MSELTHNNMIEMAKRWLWKRCVVVVTEMSMPYGEGEIPDAIGWDYGGWSIGIECKASRPDFLKDKNKKSRQGKVVMGNIKYYLIPKKLVKPEELPKGWGLLECVDRKSLPITTRIAPKDMDINPKYAKEILLLISCLRRIGGLRKGGISVRCYQFRTKNRATLGIAKDEKEARSE